MCDNNLTIAVVVRNVLPLLYVIRAVRHHVRRDPFLAITASLSYQTRYLQQQQQHYDTISETTH